MSSKGKVGSSDTRQLLSVLHRTAPTADKQKNHRAATTLRSKLTIKVNKKFALEVFKNHLDFHTTMVFQDKVMAFLKSPSFCVSQPGVPSEPLS